MHKRFIGFVLSFAILLGTLALPVMAAQLPAESSITLVIGSSEVKRGDALLEAPPVPPQIINGRTMLPFRYLVQTVLGGTVDYDAATREISAKVDGHEVHMTVDQLAIIVDGVSYDYGQAPVVIDGSTLVPVKAFEPVLAGLSYDAATQTVTLRAGAAAVVTGPAAGTTIAATGIALNKSSVSLEVAKSETLAATISPQEATDKNVTWESNDQSIVSVSTSGMVTGVAKGIAVVTAKTANGMVATCAVEVKEPVAVTGITLSSTSEKLKTGETVNLSATISPSDAADKTVTWTSSNSNIVSVSSSGTVRGVAKGSATVTAKSVNGISATCELTVTDSSSVDIALPSYPVSLNHLNSDGLVESVVEITGIKVDQTYYQHSNSVTAKIQFEGKLVSSTRSGQSSGYIEWQLLDSDGFVVDSGDRMTNRLNPGQAFRGVEAIIFDLVPGESYVLDLISGEGLSEDESTANLVLPSVPVVITEYNYSGTVVSSISVTDIRVEQEYRGHSSTVRAELFFSGKCNNVYERTNTNRKIIWTLKDSAGNVVDSGRAYTPIIKSGDTFVDASSTVYDLKAGQTYILELSTRVE